MDILREIDEAHMIYSCLTRPSFSRNIHECVKDSYEQLNRHIATSDRIGVPGAAWDVIISLIQYLLRSGYDIDAIHKSAIIRLDVMLDRVAIDFKNDFTMDQGMF